MRLMRSSSGFLVIATAVCALAHGQVAPLTADPGDARSAGPAPYRIQAGDLLGIAVSVGMPDYSPPPQVTVGPDGAFAYPLVGDVHAAGKTRQEVAESIKQALQRLYRKVTVAVNIERYGPREVFILGEVVRPGPVTIVGETVALEEAVAQVGGYTENAAEVTLYSGRAEPRLVSRDQGSDDAATALRPGDVVNVGKRLPLMVVGEVARPGPVHIPDGGRLTDALALAGGAGPEADAQHAVLVNHESRTIVVDLEEVLRNPQAQINLPVADYHTLVVPPRRAVAVIGEVRQPGLYRAGHGMRLTALLALAGGLTPTAASGATAVDESGQIQALSIQAAAHAPGSEADVLVDNLRTVVVPRDVRAITVVGEVAAPGVISPDALPAALSAVLAAAGGPTATADLRRVLVSQRDGTQNVFDVGAVFGMPELVQPEEGALTDPMVLNGAVVTVPRRYARVTVLGAVEEPGSYTFAEGDTVVDAIALARGFARKGAALRKIALLRRRADGVDVTEVNMRAGLGGGEDLLAGPLHDRDIVMVPQAKEIDWAKVATILFGISTVYRNVID